MLVKTAIVVAAFAAGVGLAELFGAKNLGTAFGIGQLTFALALVYVLVRREQRPDQNSISEPSETVRSRGNLK